MIQKKNKKDAMQTYTAFFNTEPQLGSLVVGITAGLEEARANGDAVDGETINGMRAGLMGPIAGIGDSLIVGTLIPVLLGIALGLSKGGKRRWCYLLHRRMELPSLLWYALCLLQRISIRG